MKIALFGKGHLGAGLLSDKNYVYDNEVIVLDRENIDRYASDQTLLNTIDLAILAIGESGGVAFNINNGSELFNKNLDLNTKILRIVSRLKCRTINFIPACVYPYKGFGTKSKESDLFHGPLEVSSMEYAKSQLNRIEALNNVINQTQLKHVVLTNIFGKSYSSTKNSHFFDHLIQSVEVSRDSQIVLKGSGEAIRDFLYNKEVVGIIQFLMTNWSMVDSVSNFAGYGSSKIIDITQEFLSILGLQREIHFNNPEFMGVRYKVLDDSKSRALGWQPSYEFKDAILDWCR